jgi:hypothetical protein
MRVLCEANLSHCGDSHAPLEASSSGLVSGGSHHDQPFQRYSGGTGDAWRLDPAGHSALPLARAGDPQPVHIEETNANFAIARTGQYRIDGPAFVYFEQDTRQAATIFGYPTEKFSQEAGA